MEISVRLFTDMKKYHPEKNSNGDSCTITVGEDSTVRTALDQLRIPRELPIYVLVNRRHAPFDKALEEGDVLSILKPLSGG